MPRYTGGIEDGSLCSTSGGCEREEENHRKRRGKTQLHHRRLRRRTVGHNQDVCFFNRGIHTQLRPSNHSGPLCPVVTCWHKLVQPQPPPYCLCLAFLYFPPSNFCGHLVVIVPTSPPWQVTNSACPDKILKNIANIRPPLWQLGNHACPEDILEKPVRETSTSRFARRWTNGKM